MKLENKNNKLVEQLFKKNLINKYNKNKLSTKTSICPRIYGNPKIHKESYPLRPVISTIDSPAYKMSKYLAKILSNISVNSPYSVKNSFEFKNIITEITLNQNDRLFSLDVTSLFTNVDIMLAKEAINKKWNEIEEFTPLDRNTFIQLIEFCVQENNIFQYNNTYYKQIHGLFMGNPLSGILADLALDEIIENALKKIDDKNIHITFIKKYVDDLILATNENNIDETTNIFNSIDQRIQFTVEKEKCQAIPFLDLNLIRYGKKIITEWYNKPTSSNRIINFLSKHPFNIKINTAKSFAARILSLSHQKFKFENHITIKNILEKNNYPHHIITKIIKQASYITTNRLKNNQNNNINSNNNNTHNNTINTNNSNNNNINMNTNNSINTINFNNTDNNTNDNINTNNAINTNNNHNNNNINTNNTNQNTQTDANLNSNSPKKIYKSLTYIPKLTENLCKKIRKANENINIALKPKNKLRTHFSKLKDKTMKNEKSNVIYQVKCNDCAKIYIGQTGRKFTERLKEHNRYIRNNNPLSGLAMHAIEKNHTFNFNEAKILSNETNKFKRETKEALEIFRNRHNTVNIKRDLENVQQNYHSII